MPGLIEEGGIYSHAPRRHSFARGGSGRPLGRGEHEAVCSRCGQRFTATEGGTAEELRDLHFYGDEGIPSICL